MSSLDGFREYSSLLDEAVLLAIELDAVIQEDACDETCLDHLSSLDCARQDTPLLAALWLRAAVAIPRPTFLSKWWTLPSAQRIVLVAEMLDLQPGITVRVLGPVALAALLEEIGEPAFHRAVAQALTLCRAEGSERCLVAMLPEAQAALAPMLAESAAAGYRRVPHWLMRLSPQAQRNALLRFAMGAVANVNDKAFNDCLSRLHRSDRHELESLLQQRLRNLPSEGVHMLAERWLSLPGSESFTLELCSVLIRNADHTQPPETLIEALAGSLSDNMRGALATRPDITLDRLSPPQQALRTRFVGSRELSGPCARRYSPNATPVCRGNPPFRVADLPSPADAVSWSARQWMAFERSVRTTPNSVKRAQMLLRLVSAVPAERLPAFGNFATELDFTAWRRQAISAVFTRALALGLNPWSVVKGADRRDAIAALIGLRLSRSRFEVLGHRAWSRLDHIQRLALYRLVFDKLQESHDVAQRSASLESLCAGIVGLPASLAVVMAIQVIKYFNRDPAMTADQLWRLAGITDVTLPQRQELMRVAALAFWLRGDEWSGARCHAIAEACKARAANDSVRRFLEATGVPSGSSPDARPRRAAAAISMLETDDPEAADQVAACLDELEPQHRKQFIAHLIVQGQATQVLMALSRDIRGP